MPQPSLQNLLRSVLTERPTTIVHHAHGSRVLVFMQQRECESFAFQCIGKPFLRFFAVRLPRIPEFRCLRCIDACESNLQRVFREFAFIRPRATPERQVTRTERVAITDTHTGRRELSLLMEEAHGDVVDGLEATEGLAQLGQQQSDADAGDEGAHHVRLVRQRVVVLKERIALLQTRLFGLGEEGLPFLGELHDGALGPRTRTA